MPPPRKTSPPLFNLCKNPLFSSVDPLFTTKDPLLKIIGTVSLFPVPGTIVPLERCSIFPPAFIYCNAGPTCCANAGDAINSPGVNNAGTVSGSPYGFDVPNFLGTLVNLKPILFKNFSESVSLPINPLTVL